MYYENIRIVDNLRLYIFGHADIICKIVIKQYGSSELPPVSKLHLCSFVNNKKVLFRIWGDVKKSISHFSDDRGP